MFLLASDPAAVFLAPVPSTSLVAPFAPVPPAPGAPPAVLMPRILPTYAPAWGQAAPQPAPVPVTPGTVTTTALVPNSPYYNSPNPGASYSSPATSPLYNPNLPVAVSAAAPTTLPTMTTWANTVGSNWVMIAAIILAVVLIASYRHKKA